MANGGERVGAYSTTDVARVDVERRIVIPGGMKDTCRDRRQMWYALRMDVVDLIIDNIGDLNIALLQMLPLA